MIHCACPHCGVLVQVADEHAGRMGVCGSCGKSFQFPAAGQNPPEAIATAQRIPPRIAPSPGAAPSKTMAVACLVLGIVSLCCFGPFAGIPAIIMGVVVLSQSGGQNNGRGMAVTGIVMGVLSFILPVVLILAAIMMPALARAREAARRSSCQNNLKQLGLVCKMFANEQKDLRFPLLSATPGKLMFEKDDVYPELMSDSLFLWCPSNAGVPPNDPEALLDDESYFYVGYAITNDGEAQALSDAYRARIAKGQSCDADLEVASGQGTAGGSLLHLLREGIERELTKDPSNQAAAATAASAVPIIIERPDNHVPKGGNVLYFDGHVAFVRYGQWPMTDATMAALAAMDAAG